MKIIITEGQIRNIIRNVLNKFSNEINLPDGNYEFVNDADIKKYSKCIWDILQRSYRNLGGFKSYETIDEMTNLISLAIICVRNKEIVACAIYRDDLGGQKLNGCGTIDGSEKNKEILRSIIKEDIENLKKYRWVEVSYPLEKWFKELGGNPIPSAIAHKLLHKGKDKIVDLNDGIHYQREMGKDKIVVTKAIYGFKSQNVYEMVMNNIEKYTGFETYNEFKSYANTLPKINEDFDYELNHSNKEVSVAMETIIQIGNLWEEGVRELTPNMHVYLENSIRFLTEYPEKNKQILALIKTGTYYYNNMDILKCYTSDDYDYIVKPAI